MNLIIAQLPTATNATHSKNGAYYCLTIIDAIPAKVPANRTVLSDVASPEAAGYIQLPDSPALARAKCVKCAKIGGWLIDPTMPTYTIDQARADQAIVMAAWSIAQVNAVRAEW